MGKNVKTDKRNANARPRGTKKGPTALPKEGPHGSLPSPAARQASRGRAGWSLSLHCPLRAQGGAADFGKRSRKIEIGFTKNCPSGGEIVAPKLIFFFRRTDYKMHYYNYKTH